MTQEEEDAREKLGVILSECADGIDACVEFGSDVMTWLSEASTEEYWHATPVLLLRHILEMADAISLCIRNETVDPAKILLRSLFEALLGLEHVLAKDTKRRSLAYQVVDIQRRLDRWEELDPNTQRGKQYRSSLSKDKHAKGVQLPSIDSDEKGKGLRRLLQDPQYRPVTAEWKKVRAKKKGAINWYSLFGGPQNLHALAETLHHPAWYHTLYREWSEKTHGSDGLRYVRKGKGGMASILAFRQPIDAEQVTCFTMTMCLIATHESINTIMPEKKDQYTAFYLHIRDVYQAVCKSERIIIKR